MSATDTALVPAGVRSDRTQLQAFRAERGPSSIEKAAMILAAIGPESAADFLRQLSAAEMQRFARAISGLGKIRQEVLDAVIVEFLEALTSGPAISGGTKAARKLLASVMDETALSRLLDVDEPGESRSVWDQLNDTPVTALASFLAAEHPQTVAVVLSEMRPEVAASILERLERGFAQTVVLRLSRVPALDAAISASIQGAIERDFLSVLQRNLSKRRPADLIAGLMNNISTEAREGFLSYLEGQEPALAQDVQRTMFTFEDIAVRLHGRDIASVLRDVAEEILLTALKHGQSKSSPTVPFILENVPRRLSERYVEELAALEEPTRKEGEAAQIEITKAIQAQAREGTIRFIEKDTAFG